MKMNINNAVAVAGIASLVLLLSSTRHGALGRKRAKVGHQHHVVRVHTAEGRVLYRYYYQLSREEQQKIDLGVKTTYRRLLHTIADNPVDDLSTVPTIQELSCGIDIHHGGGGTISFGCSHGWYFCVVTITGDEGISGECAYDPPTPAIPG